MYLESIKKFGKLLRKPVIPARITLDLSHKRHTDKLIKRDLGEILKHKKQPSELTIDFGGNRLSDEFMASLVEGLSLGNGSTDVTLCFLGNISLSANSIHSLINNLITNQQFQAALTLCISGINLEWQKRFNQFIDAITSPECIPWLTVEFLDPNLGCPHISSENITYLIAALSKKTHALGLSINIGQAGTDEQRHMIHQHTEQIARLALKYLNVTTQYSNETHTQLTIRTKESLERECINNKKWVKKELQQHIELLKLCTLNKTKRIAALERLQTNLSDRNKNSKSIYEIIFEWEALTTKDSMYTQAQLISSMNAFLSYFRSKEKALTSTQILIAQLKLDYADAPCNEASKLTTSSRTTSVLSIATVESYSPVCHS